MRIALFMLMLLASYFAFTAQARAAMVEYEIDPSHTRVIFFISHTGFSQMIGAVHGVSGRFRFDPDQPEKSGIEVALDPKTVDTFHTGLNEKLQGKEFFDTAAYPDMRFVSTAIQTTGASAGTLTGNLTMHGVTKPVTLKVTLNKAGRHPITNNLVAGFSAETTIKRSEFGMNYGAPDLIGDNVRILIEMEGDNATADKQTPKRS